MVTCALAYSPGGGQDGPSYEDIYLIHLQTIWETCAGVQQVLLVVGVTNVSAVQPQMQDQPCHTWTL